LLRHSFPTVQHKNRWVNFRLVRKSWWLKNVLRFVVRDNSPYFLSSATWQRVCVCLRLHKLKWGPNYVTHATINLRNNVWWLILPISQKSFSPDISLHNKPRFSTPIQLLHNGLFICHMTYQDIQSGTYVNTFITVN
jgi:hypothetical protein